MDLVERLSQLIDQQRLLSRGERLVVAVSGGQDSMVLLHLLARLREEWGWKVSVAHFNHQLRGRSSAADARFVAAAAGRLGLPCDVGCGDVRSKAVGDSLSIEMAARELRHAFLARCARKRRAGAVVLGQHADDQVELYFMRLLRGAGGAGLGGMRLQSASPADVRVRLVRPLLEFSKVDLAAYAGELRIRFRTDASNQSDEFDRNWVRQCLLPLLRSRYPGLAAAISRSMRIAQAESDFVLDVAKEWRLGEESRLIRGPSLFRDLPVAVQRQVIQQQLLELQVEPDFQLVETLRINPGEPVTAEGGRRLLSDENGTVQLAPAQRPDFLPAEALLHLPRSSTAGAENKGSVRFGGITLKWRLLSRSRRILPARSTGTELFDAERLGAWLLLRHWRPGDRFRPIGLRSATKLQDWFTNRKVPAAKRRELVVAESERGEIFWVEGERIGENAKITARTRRMLEISWKRG